MKKSRTMGTAEPQASGGGGAPQRREATVGHPASVIDGRRRSLAGRLRTARTDGGMTTAEYAVGTLAACGFAGLLLKVLTSGGMATLLRHLVERALAVAG